MAVNVSHDPLARGSYHRECRANMFGECTWCGQKPNRLYTYTWIGDDSNHPIIWFNPHQSKHEFCNLDCFKSYYG